MEWTSIIRNILLMLGSVIAQNGWMTEAEWQTVVGGIIIVGVAIWKAVIAQIRKRELADAKAAPAEPKPRLQK